MFCKTGAQSFTTIERNKMKILLIGGAGFIGGHLATDLEIDHSVISIDKKFGTNVNSTEDLSLIAEDYDTVVFLAAEPNLAAVKRDPVAATHTMTSGLINCLAKFKGSHFIFFSSSMVYGNWDSNLTAKSEIDKCSPIDLYGRLKHAGEGLVRELHNNWTIVRPTAVYGQGDDPERVLPKFINIAKQGGEINVLGHDNCLDFTHVSDVVQGVRLIVENPSKSINQVYNISYGQSHALDIVADFVCTYVKSGTYKITQRDYDYPARGALSTQKIRTELGYHPLTDFNKGIVDLICE